MSKSKDKKNNDNELLSFEELKNKVNHETAKDEKPDSEINDLLSALGDPSLIAEIVLKYFIKAFAFASPIPLIFVREVESVLFLCLL